MAGITEAQFVNTLAATVTVNAGASVLQHHLNLSRDGRL